MMRRMPSREAGSLPLALLAAIVIGGLIVALYGVIMSGVRSSARDRDLAAAIQVADAGLQEAFVALQQVEEGEPPDCDTNGDGSCNGTLRDGSPYRWEYEVLGERLWRVTSVGTHNDHTRAVRAQIGERPLFGAAIVTDDKFTYNGGGGGTDPFPIGGFQDLVFNGSNTGASISTLFLYGEENLPSGSYPDPDTWERTKGPDLWNIAEAAFATGGVCDGQSETISASGGGPIVLERRVYCLTGELDLKSDVVLESGEGPTVIYIQSGGMTVGPSDVNKDGDAVDLQIYVGADSVRMNGNFNVSAAIYAPNSSCVSNGQGGGGFAGGMICNEVDLNGNFDYDPSITAIVDDTFAIRGWHEEPSAASDAP